MANQDSFIKGKIARFKELLDRVSTEYLCCLTVIFNRIATHEISIKFSYKTFIETLTIVTGQYYGRGAPGGNGGCGGTGG